MSAHRAMPHNMASPNIQRQYAPPTNNTSSFYNTKKPLNFLEAMSDFETMFSDIDRDVIETVLRANNGVVQPTIDQLLVLQETTPQEKHSVSSTSDFPNLPSYEESSILSQEDAPPAYSDIWEDLPTPKNETNGTRRERFFDNPVFIEDSRWNPPLIGKLPDDFLRLDIQINSSINNNTTGHINKEDFMTEDEVEQFLEDEKLAMFLQNEEFLRQLRRNKDFVTALDAGEIILYDVL